MPQGHFNNPKAPTDTPFFGIIRANRNNIIAFVKRVGVLDARPRPKATKNRCMIFILAVQEGINHHHTPKHQPTLINMDAQCPRLPSVGTEQEVVLREGTN